MPTIMRGIFMKKGAYLLIGVLAGSIFSTAIGANAAQIKSLVGAKVAAEYTVKVDGQKLTDKAVIINNKAMVPLRSVSDSLGADIKVDSKAKSIEVNSSDLSMSGDSEQLPAVPVPTYSGEEGNNEYLGLSRSTLQGVLNGTQENRLKPLQEDRNRILEQIELGNFEKNEALVAEKQQQLDECDRLIAQVQITIAQLEAALKVATR